MYIGQDPQEILDQLDHGIPDWVLFLSDEERAAWEAENPTRHIISKD